MVIKRNQISKSEILIKTSSTSSSINKKCTGYKSYNIKSGGAVLASACVIALTGCQSVNSTDYVQDKEHASILTTPTYKQQLQKDAEQYKQLFANNGTSSDVQAKTALVQAINKHLHTDHVAISKISGHSRPFLAADSVDATSTSAWTSWILPIITEYLEEEDSAEMSSDYEEAYEDNAYDDPLDDIKQYDSHDEVFYGEAYRKKEDYLASPQSLYLSYGDEKYGRLPTPDYSINRQIGMSDGYREGNLAIDNYGTDVYDCIDYYSSDIGDLITNNPELTSDDEQFKAITREYEACQLQVKEDHIDIINNAIGYQRQYLNRENVCSSDYERNMADFFDPNRSFKTIDLEQYNTIFNIYEGCDYQVLLSNQNEPASYISEQWPTYRIEYNQDLINCNDDLLKQQQKLQQAGVTYKNNPDSYLDVSMDRAECEAMAEAKRITAESDMIEVLLAAAAAEDENDADYNYDYESEDESESAIENDNDYEYVAVDYDDYEYEEYEEDSPSEESNTEESNLDLLNEFIASLKMSPEQVAASNLYINQYVSINSISEYSATDKRINKVYSYDYASPTSYHSIKLPIAFDFSKSKVTVDPSAILPIMAIVAPESTPLPNEYATSTFEFGLPDAIKDNIPPEVIYDAFLEAVSHSLNELDNSNFSAIDIRDDAFAKQLGASKAIKVNLGSKQTGKVIGAVIKHMGETFNRYLEDNPDSFYGDNLIVMLAIAQWQEVETKYQSQDVASLIQMIEAISPFTFNKANYYYLDSKGQLLGKQVDMALGADLMQATSTTLIQTRYDLASFNKHPLNKLFTQSYGLPFKADTPQAIDGNALIKKAKQRKARLQQAKEAREYY